MGLPNVLLLVIEVQHFVCAIHRIMLPLECGRNHVNFASKPGDLGHVARTERHFSRIIVDVLASIKDESLGGHAAEHQNFERV